MAVSKKGKRSFLYNGKVFYWYMKLTDDYMYSNNLPLLHIISEDKRLILSYQPKQQIHNPFIIVKKGMITGFESIEGIWKRIMVPKWNDDVITPSFVNRLLDWFYDDKKSVILVDYLGNLVK